MRTAEPWDKLHQLKKNTMGKYAKLNSLQLPDQNTTGKYEEFNSLQHSDKADPGLLLHPE
jgi:hypothetical protein